MSLKVDYFKFLFICTAIISLFFVDKGDFTLELSSKLLSLVFLSFYYLKNTTKINYCYVLVLLFSCLSSSLLVFGTRFLIWGTFFLLMNRVLYIIISKRAFFLKNKKRLIMFMFVFFIPIIVIFPQLQSNLKELTYPILMIGVLSAIMCSLAFVNYFDKMIKSNQFFLLGMLVFVLADILTVYNQFIHYDFCYVMVYTTMYIIARYFVCKSMIMKRD